MKENSEYVMLPSKSESPPPRFQTLRKRVPIFLLIAVVAVVSWWGGSRSGQSQLGEGDLQVSSIEPDQAADLPPVGTETANTSGLDLVASFTGASESVDGEKQAMPNSNQEAEPGVGGISITTEPSGAKIAIQNLNTDETHGGESPLAISNLSAGFYEVSIDRPGYRHEKATFEVVADRIRELEPIRLTRVRGVLDIQTTQPARYELYAETGDDMYELVASGNAPGKVKDLPVSTYRLAINRPGWPTISRDVTLADGMITEVEQDFPEGSLKITSNPDGAEVWVKGQHQEVASRAGVTPIQVDQLPVGAYEVVLRHRAGPDQRLLYRVKGDAVTEGHGSWSSQSVMITSDPPGATIYSGAKRIIGEDSEVTPLSTLLLEGRHDMYAVRPRLKDVHLAFQVAPESPNQAHFVFQYGSLQITTDPEGAEVWWEDQSLGETPLLVTQMAPGKHRFQLRKERYSTREVSGLVTSGNHVELSSQLQYDPMPKPGQDFTNGLGQRMIWIDGLGCWVESTETPQSAYEQISTKNPSQFFGPQYPVDNITWNEALKFCEKLTIAERGQGFVPDGYRYHLPTDQQWTFFAAGTPLATGVTSHLSQRQGPQPVGSLEPNRFGLHDVRGNVWEWCRDWYTLDAFNREQQENATAKADRVGTRFKILRGGSWNRAQDTNLALGYRLLADPNSHQNYETGFRVILEQE